MAKGSSTDVTAGIREFELDGLSQHQRDLVLRLMARVSEKSYRRGFQQGAHIALNRPLDLPRDIHDWRYGRDLDQSPWADCDNVQPSLGRLNTEVGNLHHIGLRAPLEC